MHMCYRRCVDEVGLREMRQNASGLVRRAEAGERITITVAGRPAAVLGPVSPRTWRRWPDLTALFASPTDPQWAADRDRFDDSLADAWARR
jgi:prevent-host-death family protein